MDLSHNFLVDVKELKNLTKLKHLKLDNNFLNDRSAFGYLQNLNILEMNNNKFVNLEKLVDKLSKAYPRLEYLSLLGNDLCPAINQQSKYIKYQQIVADRLPKLKYLDFKALPKRKKNSNDSEWLMAFQHSASVAIHY